ncbi:MAG TPA: hydrogenase expression/formation protein HypE [Anaerolineae bacterium]|nr:hydrogenase expression/formation protein HypE [Anaerolineae bacterium]
MQGPVCPVPVAHNEQIVIGHGSGGKMTSNLINKSFLPQFDNPVLNEGNDAGVITLDSRLRLAISTDSHVVSPLFFPGGDIGKLAVCGTVNDVAMMGATPLYLTAGFIIEEGLNLSVLNQIIVSMKDAAQEANVEIIAGDTKVVQRGYGDGLYINTSGIGVFKHNFDISGSSAKPGDLVILSGSIGDHGMAVLTARNELGFEVDIKSDIAPLNHLVSSMLDTSEKIHVLRDPTRGGVASTLNEIASQSHICIELDETSIPVHPHVNAICEMLGFDPLYVANEGKLIAIVARDDADKILGKMHKTQYGKEAVIVGEVKESPQDRVLMRTSIGSLRVVETLSGELLPRIC